MSLELVALPHAGGGAAAFGAWRRGLGSARLRALLWGDELERLGHEAPLEALAGALGRRLERKLQGQFALVGASAGGRVALALADWLSRRAVGARLQFTAVISLPTPRSLPTVERLARLGDAALFSELQQLGGMSPSLGYDATLFRSGLERTRRELGLFRAFAAVPRSKPRCPLYFCAGHRDPLVDVNELARISSELGAECDVWPGDHFFWLENAELQRLIVQKSAPRPAALPHSQT